MLNLIPQPKQPCHMQALSSAIINMEVRESHRVRYRIVASKMSVYLNNADEEIARQMFNHFCEHVLPVTFCDWMKKS
ncbi:conserved hypothetical protein [Candidatus Nitrotoga sp. HW29]|uniref:hypothetical protein n=1 Tax=Candidatus Nitrotoga sp. HW29 TaxID=2886963 RepID=UPI001EF1C95F|nr:hypothetical protein [Candidatus Nitrotoga sp. HW29]CAH1903944.1 conserved hypothetical protein [Candidatus Nitrotoga sp. HW29]